MGLTVSIACKALIMIPDPAMRERGYECFRQEAPKLLEILEKFLLQGFQENFSINTANTLMRAAHTLKGAAASVGLETIRTVAKSLEDIFRTLCRSNLSIDPVAQVLLFEVVELLRLALNAELAGKQFDQTWVLNRTTAIVDQLQAGLGTGFDWEANLPDSTELGFDMTQAIFEEGVTEHLDEIAAALATAHPEEIARMLQTRTKIFLGLAESLNLSGFETIAQATLKALKNHPDQGVRLTQIALKDFRAGQMAVLSGDRSQGGLPSEQLQQLADSAPNISTQTISGANQESANSLLEDIWGDSLRSGNSQLRRPPIHPQTISAAPSENSDARVSPTAKILIVDDSLTVRQTLTLILEQADYEVVQARDGYEAIERLQQQPDIQLVICDIEMPQMDGLEFLSCRRHEPRLAEIPVAILTSLNDEKYRLLALQLGAAAYMTKPVLAETVLATVKLQLEKSTMNKPQRGRVNFPDLIGGPLLIGVALIWTLGVLGSGIWWFIQRSSAQSAQSEQAYPPETFAQVQQSPAGLFSYGGSTAWAPIRLQIDSAIQAERLEFQLRYIEPPQGPTGSDTGIQMLLDDQLTLAQSARPLLDQEYRQAEQRGFKLKQIPIAIDGIAIAVNPELEIPGLTVEQLRAIYSGEMTNWQAAGGPDLAITPYSRPMAAGGAVEFFSEDILAGQTFGQMVEFIPTTTQALRRLADTSGGIYYASAPAVVPQCSIKPLPIAGKSGEFVSPYRKPIVTPEQCPNQRNQVNAETFRTGQYPLTHYLYVVVKQNGRIEEQAGNAYAEFLLTDQGQEAIARAGFIRIR